MSSVSPSLSKITAAGIGRAIVADGWAVLYAGAMADDPVRLPATGDAEPPVRKERAIASKSIAAIAVAFVLAAFGISNGDSVPVDYLVLTRDSPLIVVIAVSALLGFIVGALIVWRRRPR